MRLIKKIELKNLKLNNFSGPFQIWFVVFLFLFLSAFSGTIVCAQSPLFTIVEKGNSIKDSSYYDICRVGNDEFWAIGKKGIITKFGSNGVCEKEFYPNCGIDLLNMVKMDDDNYLLCGDKGIIYQYNKAARNWKIIKVKGYENCCFYSICNVNNKIAFISGGRSKIANSQRVVPFGFILKTEDGGSTWQKVYNSIINMVWSVKFNPENNKIFALIYSPVKSGLLSSDDYGNSWELEGKKFKGLFHDFKIEEENILLAGGKNGRYKKNGTVIGAKSSYHNKATGIFWDIEAGKYLTLASGSNGDLLVKNNSGPWQLLQTPLNNNLYEICLIDEKSAFLVGNNKTIIRVDF